MRLPSACGMPPAAWWPAARHAWRLSMHHCWLLAPRSLVSNVRLGQVLLDIATSLQYMHSLRLLHGDVKLVRRAPA